jgi:hypothetical protein
VEDLSFQDTENLLEEILNDHKLIEIPMDGTAEFLVLRFPTAKDILHSRYIRKKTTLEARKEGLPSVADIDELLSTNQLTPEQDEVKINELQDKLEAQEKLLSLTKITGRRTPIEEVIAKLNAEIAEIRVKEESYYFLSQERKGDESALLYLTWACCFNLEGSRCWETFEDFENETKLNFRDLIRVEFIHFNKGLPTSTIRFLARHNLWRVRYIAALKSGGPLFGRGLNDLTPDQLGLLYWSNYYQSIYEMLPDDQPDDHVITDDDALDAHMERYAKQREQERNQGKARGSASGKLSAWDRGDELIITPDNPHYMDLQYTEDRVQEESSSEIAIVAPNSRRARNRRASKKAAARTR